MDIKKLKIGETADFSALVKIFKEVFENDEAVADAAQLEKLLSNPDFMVFVVMVNNEVIGGLTVYVIHRYYHSKPIAYVYDVGVKPNFQGKGYGKALMAALCDYCQKHGFEEAYVEAEADDIDAVNFYRKTNFSAEMNATHFTYSF